MSNILNLSRTIHFLDAVNAAVAAFNGAVLRPFDNRVERVNKLISRLDSLMREVLPSSSDSYENSVIQAKPFRLPDERDGPQNLFAVKR